VYDLKRDGGAYRSDYDDEIRQAKECERCSTAFQKKIADAERERDSLKQQLAERDAECAAMREALEEDARNFEAVDACYYSGDVARIRKVLDSSSAGKDLLERMREAEELLRRFQEIERLPQCDELLMLRDDINSFLKGEDEDMTGMFMNCTKLPPKPLLSVSKRGGKNA
jgi:septal ring factor EnvC (AmiA/AmiB activator)